MRQITILQFKDHSGDELKNLPFFLTRKGVVVAAVYAPNYVVDALKQEIVKTNYAVEAKKEAKKSLNCAVVALKTTQLRSSVSKPKGLFSVCPKHRSYYKTCGCSN